MWNNGLGKGTYLKCKLLLGTICAINVIVACCFLSRKFLSQQLSLIAAFVKYHFVLSYQEKTISTCFTKILKDPFVSQDFFVNCHFSEVIPLKGNGRSVIY